MWYECSECQFQSNSKKSAVQHEYLTHHEVIAEEDFTEA